jgi:hypothetical protein
MFNSSFFTVSLSVRFNSTIFSFTALFSDFLFDPEYIGRRKNFNVIQLLSEGSYQKRFSTNFCIRNFLKKKYDEAASEIRFIIFYADIIIYYIDRIKRLFKK